MKIKDIEVGPVYWYETAQDWGNYMTPSYDRGPVKRIDDKRYSLTGYTWSTKRDAREDEKGRYAACVKVNEDGSPTEDTRPFYLQSTHIRDTMAEVRRRYDARKAADRAAEERRKDKAAALADKAAALTARMAALGVEGVRAWATDGRGYLSTGPALHIEIDRVNAEATLTALLDRIERLEAGAYDRQPADGPWRP
jgi:hypothetical protein